MAYGRRQLTGLHTAENLQLMQALASARRAAGLSQYELAEQLGVDQSYVSKYESARRRLDVIEFLRVVGAIGVEPSLLLAQVKLIDDVQ